MKLNDSSASSYKSLTSNITVLVPVPPSDVLIVRIQGFDSCRLGQTISLLQRDT